MNAAYDTLGPVEACTGRKQTRIYSFLHFTWWFHTGNKQWSPEGEVNLY